MKPENKYKYGLFAEASESFAIDTFGKIFALPLEAVVNDDLYASVDVIGKFGAAFAEFEDQFLLNLLQSDADLGPITADGKFLFHTNYGNVAIADAVNSSRQQIERSQGYWTTSIAGPAEGGVKSSWVPMPGHQRPLM